MNSRVETRTLIRWSAALCSALVMICAMTQPVRSQIMINKGATIVTKPSSIVKVNGAYQNSSGSIDDSGTVTITTDFTNNSVAQAGGSGYYYIGGHYTNDGTWNRKTGNVVLNGTSNQNVGGAVTTTFYNLHFTNGGTKTLTHKEIVDSNCYFTNGICYTTQTNVLNFTTNGNWVNNSGLPTANAISYVDGPAEKDFNTTNEFQFPVGKTTRGNTCSITPTSSAATTFRTEYFNFKYVNTTSVLSPLVTVSKIHYWHGDVVSGTAAAKMKLYWIAGDYNLSSYMSTPSSMVVARWDSTGPYWVSEGRNAISPTATNVSGWIQSLDVTNAKFGTSVLNRPFTLGSTTADNSLPVEMGAFTVRQRGNAVELEWNTYSEIQNLGFEIERRRLGGEPIEIRSFTNDTSLLAKSPWGARYETLDGEGLAAGTYVYELFQVDINGFRTRVGTRTIEFSPLAIPRTLAVSVYPNPSTETAHLALALPYDEHVSVKLFDVSGRLIVSLVDLDLTAGEHLYDMDVSSLPSGTYSLVLSGGSGSQSERVLRNIVVRK